MFLRGGNFEIKAKFYHPEIRLYRRDCSLPGKRCAQTRTLSPFLNYTRSYVLGTTRRIFLPLLYEYVRINLVLIFLQTGIATNIVVNVVVTERKGTMEEDTIIIQFRTGLSRYIFLGDTVREEIFFRTNPLKFPAERARKGEIGSRWRDRYFFDKMMANVTIICQIRINRGK